MKIDTYPFGFRALRGTLGHMARLPVALGMVVLVGACATVEPQVAATPPVPQDPLAAFAAQAAPGTQARVTLAGGQPATVRMGRSYHAASGRECREVLVGAGNGQRAQLVCQGEGGAWAVARPLLRGAEATRR